jgi:hypothetical protein
MCHPLRKAARHQPIWHSGPDKKAGNAAISDRLKWNRIMTCDLISARLETA